MEQFLNFLPAIIIIVAILLISLVVALYSTYAERKVAAFFQDRRGPDRAGPGGIFQPFADGVKFFLKEEIFPTASSKFLFILGPCVAMTCALMTSAVIPWGKEITIGGNSYWLQATDLDLGILYVFAVVSVGIYGIMIGGWASNNKWSLMGALRASSQVISYELGMGLAIVALIMTTGTLSLREIAEQQHGFSWNIFIQPLGFLIFLICTFAETNRAPFDLPEAESELVGGYHTEYSSMKLGFFLFAEYINMFIASTMLSTLYFGGYNFPFMDMLGEATGSANIVTIVGTVLLFIKIFLFIFFFMWVRWTLPRFRYDQLMNLGWKVLVPLALLNILGTAVVMVLRHQGMFGM